MPRATLEDAIELAVKAHRGQVDKAGQPYVLHVLRVMMRVEEEPERMAAVLHDVVEDTPYTLDDLRKIGFAEEVVAAVDSLTRRDGESYEDFVTRAGKDPIARRVKIADLEDNMDLRRAKGWGEKDVERLKRYAAAWQQLKDG
jgi:(p)ppGpp synthase/HD superfamily hydrolase